MLLLILLTWEKENLSLQHLISSSDALQLSHRDLSSEIMKAIAKFLIVQHLLNLLVLGKIKSLVCVNGIINMIKPFHQLLWGNACRIRNFLTTIIYNFVGKFPCHITYTSKHCPWQPLLTISVLEMGTTFSWPYLLTNVTWCKYMKSDWIVSALFINLK